MTRKPMTMSEGEPVKTCRWIVLDDGGAIECLTHHTYDPADCPTVAHEFHEDVNDASMCVYGIPAITHDEVGYPIQTAMFDERPKYEPEP